MNSKKYFILPIVAAGAVTLSSCGEKQKPEAAEPTTNAAKSVVEKVVETVVEKAEAKGSVDELAKKAGFAQYMTKDTTVMWTMYDGAGLAKKLHGSKLGAFVSSTLEEKGQRIEEIIEDEGFQTFADIAGEEIFLSLGDGGSEEMEHLLEFSKKSNFYQLKNLVKMLATSVGGDAEGMSQSLQANNYLIELAKDPAMLKAADAVNMPPVFMGFKVSDDEKRKEFVEKLQGFGEMALSTQEEDETFLDAVEKDGFTGFNVNGAKIVELFKKQEDSLKEFKQTVGEAAAESYLASLAKKNFVTLAGEFNGYVVIFSGNSLDQLVFAETPADSVLGHKDMAFATQYCEKDLVSLLYMSDAYMNLSIEHAGTFEDILNGVKAGLSGVDSLGDTRVLEALLDDCVKCEKAYFAPYKAGRAGMVAYLEDGFKLDSFYTGNAPATDLTAKRHFSKLADMPEVLFSANWVNNSAQVERGLEYIDALGNTAYQLAKQVSGLDLEDSDFTEFKIGFSMVDGMFKQDLLDVWGALRSDLGQGLGSESALLVDIKGELPTVPNIPEEMVKSAKLPRLSYVSTVKDRSKLSGSWTKLNTVTEGLLKKAKSMTGMDIPMQRPFKSVSDGLTSWTFQIPFTHQNCTPHVSVSDEVFVIGSSPDFATEIAANYEKEATGEPVAEMELNFDVLRTLGGNWLTEIEKHGEGMMGKNDYAEFQKAQPILKGLLEAAEEVESLSSKTYEVDGELRGQVHLKVR